MARRHGAPQAQAYRAELALPLHAPPALDHVAAGRPLGNHEHRARPWRRIWAAAGFRLADKPGRGRTPRVPPLQGATVTARAGDVPARRGEPLRRYSAPDLARLISAHPDAPPPRGGPPGASSIALPSSPGRLGVGPSPVPPRAPSKPGACPIGPPVGGTAKRWPPPTPS